MSKSTSKTLMMVVGAAGAVLLGGFVAIQLVPIRVHNPPVVAGPAWDAPGTEELARRACFDCHSNEVKVPWYGHIAPVSWLVADHVSEGREQLNFSEMNREQEEAHEAGEKVSEGEMPPAYYTFLHPAARLTDDEKAALVRGLNATLGGEDEHASEGDGKRRRRRGRDREEADDEDHDD